MPRLVEEAGGELSAGLLFKLVCRQTEPRGEEVLADRSVRWELTNNGVRVSHGTGEAGAGSLVYVVSTVTTVLPSDGLRYWWTCPGCERRCDSLYLPAGRERLGCRRCCGLTYRSQQTAGPVSARKERPGLWSERTYERWEFDPATLGMRPVVRRRTRRRL